MPSEAYGHSLEYCRNGRRSETGSSGHGHDGARFRATYKLYKIRSHSFLSSTDGVVIMYGLRLRKHSKSADELSVVVADDSSIAVLCRYDKPLNW